MVNGLMAKCYNSFSLLWTPTARKQDDDESRFLAECGPAQNIQYGEIDKPSVIGSQVLVKVGAVSLNPVDTYIRNEAIMGTANPFVVGCDLVGTVKRFAMR